jgi:hypothetical protein
MRTRGSVIGIFLPFQDDLKRPKNLSIQKCPSIPTHTAYIVFEISIHP